MSIAPAGNSGTTAELNSPNIPASFTYRIGIGIARILPVLIPLAVFFVAGVIGINFGNHWDENDHIQNIHDSLQTGTFLPMGAHEYDVVPGLKGGYYGYPSVIYWIGMVSAAPEIIRHRADLSAPALLDFIQSPRFLLRFRAVCLAVSSLSILWVYLMALAILRSWRLALFAGMLIGGSWEMGYHARWAATDALVAQFAAMCLMFCCFAVQKGARTGIHLTLAAIAAGLAAGTKYPAGLIILMVLIAAMIAPDGSSFTRRIVRCAKSLVILAVVFVITTPGAVLQPTHFLAWLNYDHQHYSEHGHTGYTVRNHADFIERALGYLSLALFSRFAIIAAGFSALCVVGAIACFKISWKLAVLLLIFPIVYFAYFSNQIVLIVRNLLILAPFLAVLGAIGLSSIIKCLFPSPCTQGEGRVRVLPSPDQKDDPHPNPLPEYMERGKSQQVRLWIGRGIVALVALSFAINTIWAFYAGWTIRKSADPSYEVHQLADYMTGHPSTIFCLTDSVKDLLAKYSLKPPVGGSPDVLVMLSSDSGRIYEWPANRRGLILRSFGAMQVNFDYYPTWRSSRIIMINYNGTNDIGPAEATIELMARKSTLHTPPGYQMSAYLDCGAKDQATTGNVTISNVNGLATLTPLVAGQCMTFSSMAFNAGDLKFKIDGLDGHSQYTAGIAWWDYWGLGKEQSIYLSAAGVTPQRVVGPVALPRWLNSAKPQPPAEITFPIPMDLLGKGPIELTIKSDIPTDCNIISDLWLMEKPGASTRPSP